MSGSVIDHNPEGQGRTRASRMQDELGKAEGLPGYCTTSWKPQEFQDRVLASMRGITFAIGGIGSGKSEATSLLLLKWALRFPRREDGRPTRWFVVGPEFAMIRDEQFGKILAHARRLKEIGYGSIVRRVVYGQDPKIILRDGQSLLGRSGDQYKRMEGVEVDGAWIDEAHRQPEKAFQTAASRVRSSDDIRIAVAANPEEIPGWLWRVVNGEHPKYNKTREKLHELGSGMRVFRWASHENKANNPGVLGVIQSILEATNENFSAKQLGGRFPGTPEAPSIMAGDYGRAFVDRINLTRESSKPYSLGVDVGESSDFSWLTLMTQRGVVVAMQRFNTSTPGVPRATFYDYLENRVAHVASTAKVRVVVFDTAKAGKPVFQHLATRLPDVTVIGYPTDSRGKKSEAIEAYLLALSSGNVTVPGVWILDGNENVVEEKAQLEKELEDIVIVEAGEGKRSFTHHPGAHDDGIVSGALAYHGIVQAPAGEMLNDLSTLLPRNSLTGDEDRGSSFGGGSRGGYVF